MPQYLCLHLLLHPCSRMCPALHLGEFTLQMSLPRTPARWRSLFPPCPAQAALSLHSSCLHIQTSPDGPELGPTEPPWMQPVPQQGEEGQDVPSTTGFGGRCEPRHFKPPRVPQAVPSIALIPPCHLKDTGFAPELVLGVPLGTPSSHSGWNLAGFSGRAVPLCLPSAWLGTLGCPWLPEGQEPHPGFSTFVCLTPGLL